MIVKASIRGNGRQFAEYLEKSRKNESVRVLDISGTANPRSLGDSLAEMSAYERLTRSDKGILQVIVNPAGREPITDDSDWHRCIKIIADKIGYGQQPYAAVIHSYDGKDHMHIAFQRYEFETGLMKGVDHVGLNLKRARLDLELELKHEHLLSWQEKKAQAEQELRADLERKRQEEAQKQHSKELQQQTEKERQEDIMAQMLVNSREIEAQQEKDARLALFNKMRERLRQSQEKDRELGLER